MEDLPYGREDFHGLVALERHAEKDLVALGRDGRARETSREAEKILGVEPRAFRDPEGESAALLVDGGDPELARHEREPREVEELEDGLGKRPVAISGLLEIFPSPPGLELPRLACRLTSAG